MKKQIKKIARATGIIFSKEEQKIENIKVGDIVDLEIVKLKENKQ